MGALHQLKDLSHVCDYGDTGAPLNGRAWMSQTPSTRNCSSSDDELCSQYKSKPKSIEVNVRFQKVPLLRGKVHLILIYTAPLWSYGLCRTCHTTRARLAAMIVILSAIVNFGCSALLHNVKWSTLASRTFWRKVDHAGIFLMIAGSCAPVPLLLFSTPMSALWALIQWGVTLAGVLMCLCSDRFSISDHYGTRATVYAIVGLSNIAFSYEFWRVLGEAEAMLLVAMASAYVIGACFYGLKWPNPWPGIVGYHEVFHLMCLLAACCTFSLDIKVLARASR